ncbi:MAG: NAD-dependent deacetylase [Solirubrobacterales bacterium]|nr:NAD-dependent deacetylase [Solirubrobacterales bacterium]
MSGTLELARRIAGARSVVALTGAGISVPSGIPDFRSPGTGLWENVNPMEVAHIDAWREDPQRFWHFYGDRFLSLREKAPNGAHDALCELQRRDHLHGVITQNVDRLHSRAGLEDVIEVHGSIERSRCLEDGAEFDLDEVLARLDAADDGVPRCDDGHPLKPGVTLFGEMLDEAALERAIQLCLAADVLLCVGSSLEVYPVAELPGVVHAQGGMVALVTAGPTPWDGRAAVKLGGDVVEELEALLVALDGLGTEP